MLSNLIVKIPTKRMWYTCFGLVVVDYISRGTLSVPISVLGPTFPFLAYSVWNMFFFISAVRICGAEAATDVLSCAACSGIARMIGNRYTTGKWSLKPRTFKACCGS